MAHTPGPWEILPTVTDGPEQGVSIVGANFGGLIGAALPWPTEIDSGDFSRVEANARLIAAAPDLLAACGDALDLLNQDIITPEMMNKVGLVLQSAIARAKGE